AIRTTAKYDEAKDEWVINGQKAWATNGGIADVHVVIASVDRELGSRGHAAFVIPPGTEGCEQGAKVKKHGLRASHTADVHLDDCRVPGSCLLGGEEKPDARRPPAPRGARGRSSMSGSPGWARARSRNLRRRCSPSRRAGRRSAPRRSASPARPTSTRSITRRSASSSAARSSRPRRAHS